MALDPLLFTASPTGARSKYPVIWRAVMKILRFPLALVAPLIFGGVVRGDVTPAPRGPLAGAGSAGAHRGGGTGTKVGVRSVPGDHGSSTISPEHRATGESCDAGEATCVRIARQTHGAATVGKAATIAATSEPGSTSMDAR